MPLQVSALTNSMPRFLRIASLLFSVALLLSAPARAQSIYVATWGNGGAGEGSISTYNMDGSLATPGLITGLTQPSQMVISGNDLYVVSPSGGTVSKFNLNGSGGPWLSGLTNPTSLTVSGSDVFVSFGDGTVSRYNTAGALQSSFGSAYTSISSIAAGGGLLYVTGTRFDGLGNAGWISSFDTSGGNEQTIASHQVGASGLSYSGTSLYYLTQPGNYTVWSYNTADVSPTPAALVTGLNGATDTDVWSSTILFSYLNGNTNDGRVGTYTTLDGANLSLIAGLNEPYSIAVGAAIPEPSTYALILGVAILGFCLVRRARREASPA